MNIWSESLWGGFLLIGELLKVGQITRQDSHKCPLLMVVTVLCFNLKNSKKSVKHEAKSQPKFPNFDRQLSMWVSMQTSTQEKTFAMKITMF